MTNGFWLCFNKVNISWTLSRLAAGLGGARYLGTCLFIREERPS